MWRRLIVATVCMMAIAAHVDAVPVASLSSGALFEVQYASDPTITTTGTFDFVVDSFSAPPLTTGFLDLAVDLDFSGTIDSSEWLVQNVPLQLGDALTGQPVVSVWFDQPGGGVVDGVAYDAYFTVQDVQLPDPNSYPTWQVVNTTTQLVDWGANDPAGQTGTGAPAGGVAQSGGTIVSYLRGGVPDIAQKTNECGPTSTANSLLWLAKQYKFQNKLPATNDALILDLMKAMTGSNARPFGGLSGNQLFDGKVSYIKDKSLPLVVHGGNGDIHAKGGRVFDFIKDELNDGEDVEFLILWPGLNARSHWVTAVGYGISGTRLFLDVNDPDDGKNGMVVWELDSAGNFKSPKGTALWAVSESLVPEPATLFLLGSSLLGVFAFRKRAQRGGPARTRAEPGTPHGNCFGH
jgi:hypothetical protein